nr:MAG TPA: hypothetical protein [Caudoviricetes sp.]
MEEYTNFSDTGEDMFLDEPEATDETTSEEPEVEETQPEPETKPETKHEPPAQTLKIKYNGKEQDITMEQAVELAQKGMNYDKVLNERNGLRVDARASELIHRLAEESGMDIEEYVGFVEEQQKAMILQREIESIRDKYPDMPENAIKELASSRAAEKARKNEEAAAERKKSSEEAKQKPWIDFLREFPEYKDELPNDVIAYIEKGSTPIEAMLRFKLDAGEQKIKELEDKLTSQEQNTKNKQKSVGSVESTAIKQAVDDFLAGFDG